MKMWGFFDQVETLSDDCAKQAINYEKEEIQSLLKSSFPKNYYEFRVSPCYVLKSHIKKYSGPRIGATPLPEKFKDEEVYLREDIIDFHAKTYWLKLGRKVKKGE